MNKVELLARLKQLDLDPQEYWLIAGSAMVMYGFRKETADIDMGCSKDLADQLEKQGYPVSEGWAGKRKIILAEDVEIFEDWLYDKVEMVDAIPVLSVKGLIEMKHILGREKDMRDIQLIENALR